jgi:ABC-2 type transport system ATP-binding protein
MAMTADRLVIIGRGRLIAEATMAEFLAAGSGSSVTVRSPQAAALAALLIARGAAVTRHDAGTLVVTGTTAEEIGELARAGGLTLTGLTAHQATLEDRYMDLTRDAADYRTAFAGPVATRK